jgi:hypothetical protein
VTGHTQASGRHYKYGCHVRDASRVFDERVCLMLRQDDPLFPTWDLNATALAESYWMQAPTSPPRLPPRPSVNGTRKLTTRRHPRGAQNDPPVSEARGKVSSETHLVLVAQFGAAWVLAVMVCQAGSRL